MNINILDIMKLFHALNNRYGLLLDIRVNNTKTFTQERFGRNIED